METVQFKLDLFWHKRWTYFTLTWKRCRRSPPGIRVKENRSVQIARLKTDPWPLPDQWRWIEIKSSYRRTKTYLLWSKFKSEFVGKINVHIAQKWVKLFRTISDNFRFWPAYWFGLRDFFYMGQVMEKANDYTVCAVESFSVGYTVSIRGRKLSSNSAHLKQFF